MRNEWMQLPARLFAVCRTLNRILLARFDKSRLEFCFLWAPLCLVYVFAICALAVFVAISTSSQPVLALAVPVVTFFFMHALIIFFLVVFLVLQAYFGVFVRAGLPMFAGAGKFCAALAGLYREGGKPRSEPNERL